MIADLPIRCRCGAVEGVLRSVSQRTTNRGRCYCNDCQSFAHFLGRAADVLDQQGGTVVLQTSPKKFEIHRGGDEIACVRLRSDGLLRWYTKCCGTPLGNTLTKPWVPFVGVIEACLAKRPDGRGVSDVAGPVRGAVYPEYARGDRNALPKSRASGLTMAARLTKIIGLAWLRREHRASPFFNQKTGLPSLVPYVLEPTELREVEAARDAWTP